MAKSIIAPACGAATSQVAGSVEVSTQVGSNASGAQFRDPAALARIKKQRYSWGDIYTGKICDLIAAGLLLQSQVPGEAGMPKVQASFDESGQPMPKGKSRGRAMTVTLRGRYRAQVQVEIDDEERQIRHAEERVEAANKQKAEAARYRLDKIPKTHDAYRADTVSLGEVWINGLWIMVTPNSSSGFSYSEAVTEEICESLRNVWRLINKGTTTLDRERQNAVINEERSAIAKADSGFVSMLQSILPEGGVQA